jgi:N-acetylmuramoyl-L-alanine amidase
MLIATYVCSDIEINIPKMLNNKKNISSSKNADINISNNIIMADISVDTNGRLIIKLPRGVNEDNTVLTKDFLNKKIYISFPKGINEYEDNNVINNTDIVTNVDISSTGSMVNITLLMNSVKDYNVCFDNGQLFMDFFAPLEDGRPVVVVDAGHGGDDVGAIEKGVYEKDIDLEICNILKEMLDKENILVYYTRNDDSYPSVEERVDFANEINPDLFISIHSNYYDSKTINGTSVLYNTKDKNYYGSKWLSEIMCSEVSKSCGTYNKGILDGNDIHIVRNSNSPVALIEVGFMSNEYDFKLLTTQEGQEKIAKGIYNGIIKALTELGKY